MGTERIKYELLKMRDHQGWVKAHQATSQGTIMNRLLLLIACGLPLMAHALGDNPDANFYRRAAQDNLAEVDGGILAQHQSASGAVKQLGDIMVKDYTAANNRLRDLAVANNVDLPSQPDREALSQKAKLQALSGDDFDKAYIQWQILAHRNAIAFFKQEIASGDDLDAKHFATDALPILQSHLDTLLALPVSPPPTQLSSSSNTP